MLHSLDSDKSNQWIKLFELIVSSALGRIGAEFINSLRNILSAQRPAIPSIPIKVNVSNRSL